MATALNPRVGIAGHLAVRQEALAPMMKLTSEWRFAGDESIVPNENEERTVQEESLSERRSEELKIA